MDENGHFVEFLSLFLLYRMLFITSKSLKLYGYAVALL